MFFELLMAWGVQGTILLFGFIFVSMWDCFRITRRFYDAKKWPPSAEYLEAMGVLIGFVAMLIAALFLNRMMWELWYVFGAYTCSLKNSIAQLPGGPQKPLEHSARAAMAPWDFRTGTAEFWPGPARTSQPVARGTPDIPR
jgi:hypothetical protein